MESKKKKTFCGCKPSQKTLDLIKVLLVLVKNLDVLDELKDTQNTERWKGK